MCPVYSALDADDPLRIAFDVLASSVGVQKAHTILELSDEDWHGKKCEWMQQWDRIENAERVVTVHNYSTLKPFASTVT